MTTALAVTSRGHMLSPPDRYTPRAHVLTPPGEQSLEAALTETYGLLRQHGHLIAVYPATLPTSFLHRMHTVRAILESDRIALLPVQLPPLATGVLARQLRQLSLCDFSPGVLGSAARLLAHYIHAGALLGSVAKLDRIPVSLTAHAKSWMPGAQFAVRATPRPALVRLGGGDSDTLDGPEYATRLTLAAGNLSTDWVTRSLAPHWRVSEVQEAYLPEDSARWWGTGKLVEFAAAIADVSVLYQLVASVRRDQCHWCGLELIGDRCAFCAASVPGSAGRAAGGRAGGAAAAAGRTGTAARTRAPRATRAQPDPRQAPPQQPAAAHADPGGQRSRGDVRPGGGPTPSTPQQPPYAGPPPPQQPRPQSMPPRAEQVVRPPAQGQPGPAAGSIGSGIDISAEPAPYAEPASYVESAPYAEPADEAAVRPPDPPTQPPEQPEPLVQRPPEPPAEPPPEHSTPGQPADSATVQQGDRRP